MKSWDHVEPAFVRQLPRILARGLKVFTVLDEFDIECVHRAVLFHAVAVGHDDIGEDAIFARSVADGLAVIATSRR